MNSRTEWHRLVQDAAAVRLGRRRDPWRDGRDENVVGKLVVLRAETYIVSPRGQAVIKQIDGDVERTTTDARGAFTGPVPNVIRAALERIVADRHVRAKQDHH